MNGIPKIIHQIWSDKYKPLPSFCSVLAETWKEEHPNWTYVLWNDEMMDQFVKEKYPQYYEQYNALIYDIERWDVVRFFILNTIGGMYVDTDYECLKNIESLIENSNLAIALEPNHHQSLNTMHVLSNALMASVPHHFFWDRVIDVVFSNRALDGISPSDKFTYVLESTGPRMLSRLYSSLSADEKSDITLLAPKHVMPFDLGQIKQVMAGIENEELEACLNEAYAVHYYSYTWV